MYFREKGSVLRVWRWWGGDEGHKRDADGFELAVLAIPADIVAYDLTLRKDSILRRESSFVGCIMLLAADDEGEDEW